jgi:hypothetical protein
MGLVGYPLKINAVHFYDKMLVLMQQVPGLGLRCVFVTK